MPVRSSVLAAMLMAALVPSSPAAPLRLSAASPTSRHLLPVPHDGEALVHLTARAPGTSWAVVGREGAVATLRSGGRRLADLVLHQGERRFRYSAFLGAVGAGELELEVSLSGLQMTSSPVIELEAVELEVIPPGHPDHSLLAGAPYLLGRPGAGPTDLPLLVYQRARGEDSEYTVVLSNEDGGTPRDELMSRWGRITDIEWFYRAHPGGGGSYQAPRHRTRSYDGLRVGAHPVLRVATDNNTFRPAEPGWRAGEGRLLFALVPGRFPEREGSRELVLDAHPWTYRLAAEELAREALEVPADPSSPGVSDTRNYLHVEVLCARGAAAAALPLRAAHLVFAAQLDDGRTFTSHRGLSPRTYGLWREGWVRTTVELPPGTRAHQLRRLEARWEGRGFGRSPGIRSVRAFLLDEAYVPGPDLFGWRGAEAGRRGKRVEIPGAGPPQ